MCRWSTYSTLLTRGSGDAASGYQYCRNLLLLVQLVLGGWLGSRVVSMLDSDAEGPGFKSQLRRCRVTVLGKLFTPIVSLFTKQQNW